MSYFYTPKRTRNLYQSLDDKPFKLSRSKIDLFLQCPRCFYLDRKLGVARPPSMPFNLNSAVDHLLKKEFDAFRAIKAPHPLMVKNNIKAIPFSHPDLDTWRENFKGLTFHHKETNFNITGALDDLWIDKSDSLIVVDYKSTSKDGSISINAPWQIAYKRQLEVYQWLLYKNGFSVSDIAYFVYCNAIKSHEEFDHKLHFDIHVLPYQGNIDWIEPTLYNIHKCLQRESIPDHHPECDFCLYREAVQNLNL